MNPKGWVARLRTSRIGLRVLAFNLLLVFLPIAGILYLDVYEARLLDMQERGMVQQARMAAAALGGRGAINAAEAARLLTSAAQDNDARLRVYDVNAAVVADSAQLATSPSGAAAGYPSTEPGARNRVLYRTGAWLVRIKRSVARVVTPLEENRTVEEAAPPPEVRTALQGRYGAATRPTPGQRSLTLHSAVPIRSGDAVVGAVQVSQSTFRVLGALYDVRLRIFEVVLASVVAAATLSLLTSATLVRPLARLRRAALAFADSRVVDPSALRPTNRRDEVGDLERALEGLMRRLDAHIRLLEAFAADVAHEFKNPLASIRSAAETIGSAESADQRAAFLHMLIRDVDRLERLVSGVRELARIDGQLAHERPVSVDLGALLTELADGVHQTATDGAKIAVRVGDERLIVKGDRDRLTQAFENIVLNARSFAPPETAVDVAADRIDAWCRVVISDRGPGIPPGHLDRVFDRFFTYRPGDPARREHTGLGLAIARAIVDAYGGTISAANNPDGGARFEVRLPSA
jgi:two-component system, OmpR family, sensor histidine kinase ChvG